MNFTDEQLAELAKEIRESLCRQWDHRVDSARNQLSGGWHAFPMELVQLPKSDDLRVVVYLTRMSKEIANTLAQAAISQAVKEAVSKYGNQTDIYGKLTEQYAALTGGTVSLTNYPISATITDVMMETEMVKQKQSILDKLSRGVFK